MAPDSRPAFPRSLLGGLEGLNDGVVDGGPHLGNLFVVSRRVDAIGEQNHKKLAARIDPNGSASETEMPKAARGEEMSARGIFSRQHPPERPRSLAERRRR